MEAVMYDRPSESTATSQREHGDKPSESIARAQREHSEGTSRAHREHSEEQAGRGTGRARHWEMGSYICGLLSVSTALSLFRGLPFASVRRLPLLSSGGRQSRGGHVAPLFYQTQDM